MDIPITLNVGSGGDEYLYYDDSTAEGWFWWNQGDGRGFANVFEPSYYPFHITEVEYALSNDNPLHLQIWDDDGTDGLPNTSLFATDIMPPSEHSYDIHTIDIEGLKADINISDGTFYIGHTEEGAGPFNAVGSDTNDTGSGYSYLYSDHWYYWTDYTCMIRVRGHQLTAIELNSFTASTIKKGILLEWEHNNLPIDYIGFNVYRSINPKTDYKQLNISTLKENNFIDYNITNDITYYYKLGELNNSGVETMYPPISILYNSHLPLVYELHQNYPNPFNPETTLRFNTPEDTHISLKIYNIKGQLVSTLLEKELKAGTHNINWNGTDQTGKPLPSGIYHYRLESDNYIDTRSMLLLK